MPLRKIAVVGHKRRLDASLALLQRLALVHVVDGATAAGVSAYAPVAAELERAQVLRGIADRIDALLRLSGVEPVEVAPANELSIDSLATELAELMPRVEGLVRRIDELGAERTTLARHLTSLRRLAPLAPSLVEARSYETVALLIARRHAPALELLRRELGRALGGRYELLSGAVDSDTLGALVVFPRARAGEVEALLSHAELRQVRLPAGIEGLSFGESIAALEARIEALPGEVAQLELELRTATGEMTRWRRVRAGVARLLEAMDLRERLGATERAFVIVGWAPEPEIERLRAALADELGDECTVVELAPEAGEEPPVLLRNAPWARPFEALVRMFALPRAGTVDATPLIAVFMPLFLGMMLGDMGYGLVLLALAIVLERRMRSTARALVRITALGAAWSVVWGVAFGELFGDLGGRLLGLRPLWLSREDAHSVAPLLTFAIAVGGAHVLIGLVLGLWNAWRLRLPRRLAERAGLLLAVVAMFALAGAAAERLPRGLMTPAIAALCVALAMLVVAHGTLGIVSGPLELVATAGNVLSYLRIAAIGLASVYLAKVAHELAALAPLWLGIIVATLSHALLLVLATFSATIQALRLQYVEFFDKFYETGGVAFRPFGRR